MTTSKHGIKTLVSAISSIIPVVIAVNHSCSETAACELAKLTASNMAEGDWFGRRVSISDQVAVVGAERFATDGEGSVYVFHYNGTGWVQEQELVPPDGEPFHDWFGCSVSVSGNAILIGRRGDATVPGGGSAHVFRYNGNSWVHEQKLTAAPDLSPNFGWSVSISNDIAIVGAIEDAQVAPNAGACYVFRFDGATWQRVAKLVAPDGEEGDFFGASVSARESVILVGAHHHDHFATTDAGAAYVFRHSVGGWVFEEELFAVNPASGDRFGETVATDSGAAIIGAHGDDDIAPDAGTAYLFRYSKPLWILEQQLFAADASLGDRFGTSVAIAGDLAIVGAEGADDACPSVLNCDSGAAYVFHNIQGIWMQEQKLTASDTAAGDGFASVAIHGTMGIVGALANDDACPGDLYCNSGSAYVFAVAGDCNGNGSVDGCEVNAGTAPDVNANLIPDECELPYADIFPPGGNFVLDVDDILSVLGGFVDPAQFPEADIFPCNGNGVIDVDDISAVLSAFIGFPACVWSNGLWVPK